MARVKIQLTVPVTMPAATRCNRGYQNFLYALRRSTIGWRGDIWNLINNSRAIMSRSC